MRALRSLREPCQKECFRHKQNLARHTPAKRSLSTRLAIDGNVTAIKKRAAQVEPVSVKRESR